MDPTEEDPDFSVDYVKDSPEAEGEMRGEESADEDLALILPRAYSREKVEILDETLTKEAFAEIQNILHIITEDANDDTKKMVTKLGDEFEKINGFLNESRGQSLELVKRTTMMSEDIKEYATKIESLINRAQRDRESVSKLKKELEKAWNIVDKNTEKEIKSKETISGLRNELASIRVGSPSEKVNIYQSSTAGMSTQKLQLMCAEQEELIRRLNKEKLESDLNHKSLREEIKSLQELVEENKQTADQLQKEKELTEEEMMNLKDFLAVKKSELDREIRIREKADQQCKIWLESNDRKDMEIRSKNEELKSIKEALSKVETQLQSEQGRSEKMENDRHQINSQYVRLQNDFDEQEQQNQILMNENHEQKRKLKNFQEETNRLRENYKVTSKAKQNLAKKYKLLEEVKMGAELERDSLRSINSHLKHDLETTEKELESYRKQCDTLTRERDIAQKNFVKSNSSSVKQYSILKLSEQNKRNLEQEISGYKDEAQKMRKLIYTLEKDRDNRLNELNHMGQVLAENNEEMKMKDIIIFDSKKKIADFEKKLKEQQALYENVRTDRNVYSKNLIEANDEKTELDRKLKIMSHQVEQLKEEISSRESVLVKEHFEHSKLEKEKEALLLQIGKLQQQLDESQKMIQSQQCEENKLRHIIDEADLERIRQKKEYDVVVQERDILGTQLIRRNDELSLLYEKIRIQTSTLNKGELQYMERLEDIRVLRLEIKKLRREKAMLQTETRNVDGLRSEIFKLQRDILRERTRVKVLEEELESPMNIHRWRKLAGSDPNTYELITKIQALQKRLISKTEEVVEKELLIQQKDKLYIDIKKVLQRQPGPEIMEELQIARAAIKTKVKESKALASELNMYHSQVNEYKFEIEKLNRELQDLKNKYFQTRKKLNTEKYKSHTMKQLPIFDHYEPNPDNMETSIKPNLVTGPRFSGGGFNMSTAGLLKPSPDRVLTVVPENIEDKITGKQPIINERPGKSPNSSFKLASPDHTNARLTSPKSEKPEPNRIPSVSVIPQVETSINTLGMALGELPPLPTPTESEIHDLGGSDGKSDVFEGEPIRPLSNSRSSRIHSKSIASDIGGSRPQSAASKVE